MSSIQELNSRSFTNQGIKNILFVLDPVLICITSMKNESYKSNRFNYTTSIYKSHIIYLLYNK